MDNELIFPMSHLKLAGPLLNFTREQRAQVRNCLPGPSESTGFH